MAATTRDWVAGARPRTLTTALSPVAVGTAAAASLGSFRLGLALLALGVALSLQVAVNFANDYSDGVRGTDANRIGPDRLVASGKARPSSVRRAAVVAFAVGSLLGLALTVLSGQWWLLAVGAAAIVSAWTYTGSARPYGYLGWGEPSVFVFFGLVATLGTLVTQAHLVPWWAVAAATGVGLHAVAMLVVNNLRDLDTDAMAGKKTLAVRVGDRRTRAIFAATLTAPIIAGVLVATERPWALLTLFLLLPTAIIAVAVVAGARGRGLGTIFAGVSAVGLAYGALLSIGIALN